MNWMSPVLWVRVIGPDGENNAHGNWFKADKRFDHHWFQWNLIGLASACDLLNGVKVIWIR